MSNAKVVEDSGWGVSAQEPRRRYERELPIELTRKESIEPIVKDSRTPVIDAELEQHQAQIAKWRADVEAEQKLLTANQAEYEKILLVDRDEAIRLRTSINVSQDVIAKLEKQIAARQSEKVQKLTAEKMAIASARAAKEQNN